MLTPSAFSEIPGSLFAQYLFMEAVRPHYRILLVDDEARVLGALKRSFNQIDPELDITIAHSGDEALLASEKDDFDLVISDLRMPHTNGFKLLRQIRRFHPKTLRVVLSGQASVEKLLEILPVSHRYLEKPCPGTQLLRLLELVHVIKASKLSSALLNQVLTLTSLPCEGAIYSLLNNVHLHGASSHSLDALINADLAISIGVLRVTANTNSHNCISATYVPTSAALPSQMLSILLTSQLVEPLYSQESILRMTRLVSIKAKLIERQLKGAQIQSYKLLSMIAYLGELALVSCVGPDLMLLHELHHLRDEVTKVLGTIWGVPKELMTILFDSDFLGLREEIDNFFPPEQLELLSNSELLGIYSEILCSIE
jgi:DNA-binding response OmpR family regulator